MRSADIKRVSGKTEAVLRIMLIYPPNIHNIRKNDKKKQERDRYENAGKVK